MQKQQLKSWLGPLRYYLILIGVIAASAALGYFSGHTFTQLQEQQLLNQQGTIASLNEDNHQLTRQINIVGVELEIERRANQSAQQDLQAAISEAQQIRQELSFYQKVMAPELSEDGFLVDDVEVETTGVANRYRLSVVLMQQERRKSFIRGNIQLELHGLQNGQPTKLDLLPLIRPKRDSLGFRFRYFEVLKIDAELPEDFTPLEIFVEATLSGSKDKKRTFSKQFAWQLTSRDTQ